MKKSLFDRRIPTAFAFLFLLGTLGIALVLINQQTFLTSKAGPQDEPQNVSIVNITNNQFTVVFTTSSPTVSGISVVNSEPPRVVFDKRDTSGQKAFTSHFITVTGLQPKAVYEFNILSNGQTYLSQGKLFSITTAAADIAQASDTFPIVGSVLLPNGEAGSDTLILLDIPNTTPAAAITDDKGNYRVSANYIRNQVTFDPITITPKTPIKISAFHGDSTSITTSSYEPGATIPPVTLTNDYSFIASDETKPEEDPSSLLALPTSSTKATQLRIMVPTNNQTFTDKQPQFRGVAIPNTLIRLVISNVNDTEAQVRSDSNGNWTYRPSVSLTPGLHTFRATAANASGAQTTASSLFTIFQSGSQIAESATPSASLTPTRAVTATITPTQAVVLSLTPTSALSITPTLPLSLSPSPTIFATVSAIPTILPTTEPTQPIVSIPPKATIPPTGGSTTAIILTSLSILFIVTGSIFLFIL